MKKIKAGRGLVYTQQRVGVRQPLDIVHVNNMARRRKRVVRSWWGCAGTGRSTRERVNGLLVDILITLS